MKVEFKTISLFSEFSLTVFGHQMSEVISMEHRKRKIRVIHLYTHKSLRIAHFGVVMDTVICHKLIK